MAGRARALARPEAAECSGARLRGGVQNMKHKIKNIHFVGIGGSGMSGIAEVLVNLGLASAVRTRRTTLHHRRLVGPMAWLAAAPRKTPARRSSVKRRHRRQSRGAAGGARRFRWCRALQMLAEPMRLKCGIAVVSTAGRRR